MTSKHFARFRMMGALIAVCSLPLSATAQAPACPCMVSTVCCTCANGSQSKVDISTGVAPWRVTRPSATTSELAIGAGSNGLSIWTTSLPGAQWVVAPGTYAGGPPIPVGNYTYTLQYLVPQCVIGQQPVITVQFAADDSPLSRISGTNFAAFHFVATSQTPPTHTLPASFSTPGAHTLTVVVNNSSGPTGLLLKGTMTTSCPLQP